MHVITVWRDGLKGALVQNESYVLGLSMIQGVLRIVQMQKSFLVDSSAPRSYPQGVCHLNLQGGK